MHKRKHQRHHLLVGRYLSAYPLRPDRCHLYLFLYIQVSCSPHMTTRPRCTASVLRKQTDKLKNKQTHSGTCQTAQKLVGYTLEEPQTYQIGEYDRDRLGEAYPCNGG